MNPMELAKKIEAVIADYDINTAEIAGVSETRSGNYFKE